MLPLLLRSQVFTCPFSLHVCVSAGKHCCSDVLSISGDVGGAKFLLCFCVYLLTLTLWDSSLVGITPASVAVAFGCAGAAGHLQRAGGTWELWHLGAGGTWELAVATCSQLDRRGNEVLGSGGGRCRAARATVITCHAPIRQHPHSTINHGR